MSDIDILIAMFIAVLVAASRCQQLIGGPDNIIAISSHDATLFCNRSASADVLWKFIPPGVPPGSDHEQDIPGRYHMVKTNYGVNCLVVEHLQLSDAGTYVCRSAGAVDLKPAAAIVLVIAQKPHCQIDHVNTTQSSISCSVTYAGQMNVSLSLQTESTGTFLSKIFTAQSVASTHAVSSHVPRSAVQKTEYSCRVSFFSTHNLVDVAKNQPGFVDAKCYVPFVSVDGSDLTTETTVDSLGYCLSTAAADTGNCCLICLIVIPLLLIVTIMALYTARRQLKVMFARMSRRCCGNIAFCHVRSCEADDDNQCSPEQVSQDIAGSDIEHDNDQLDNAL